MKKYNRIKCGFTLLAALFVSFSFVSCRKAPRIGKTERVLFVGNSLTYANDLPGVIAGLAKSRNSAMEYAMYAPGAYTLAQHAADPRLLEIINKGHWDFVVLQEQSQIPAFPWAKTQVFPYAQKLSQLIRAANPGVNVAFYQTMARKNGDAQNARYCPEVGTYDGMQKRLNDAYTQMALENQGVLVPVGEVWQKVRAQHPSLDLYNDEVHPNPAGTYLAACVFYAVIYGDDPVGLPHPFQINPFIARSMQKSANDAVKPGQPPL